jgi:predicted nucleic-acid-binding Zn-ribbon protein
MKDITCPHCGFTEEPCFFPDLFCEDEGDNYDIHDQVILLQKIQSKGFNVVTCGECGYVLIHEIGE